MAGEVVGINELGGNGVGFAIPSNLAKQVFADVLHYGKVPRGYLGLSVLPVSKLGRTTGALVSSVTPGSPAAKAGVQPGDMITALDGAPVTVRFFEQIPVFYQRVARLPSGQTVHLDLLRNGQAVQAVHDCCASRAVAVGGAGVPRHGRHCPGADLRHGPLTGICRTRTACS